MTTAIADTLSRFVDDKAPAEELKALLEEMHARGETVEEIASTVNFLRSRGAQVTQHPDAIDCCGTGGDQKGTFNISTAVSFVLAGGGLKVAKHGNRSVSSKSGAADVLEALGFNLNLTAEQTESCLQKTGIAFFFAPIFYPIMGKVREVRKSLGHPSLFNFIGPLLNPVHAKKQLLGVYDKSLVPLVAKALKELGSESAVVVSAADGLDEFSLTGPAHVAHLKNGEVQTFEFDPRESGYDLCSMDELVGGTAEENALRLQQTLKGHSKAIDHVVHINAAWGFVVAGVADTFLDGLLMAQDSISSGRAYEKLQELIEVTNE